MKTYFLLSLCCLVILATHLEHNQEKSHEAAFENLYFDTVQEIMSHLDQNSKENFASISKEHFKLDPRGVLLNLPLKNRDEPSHFVCDQLKIRKNLTIELKDDFDHKLLFAPDSLDMKYLKCMSGIQFLRFEKYVDQKIVLAHPNFNLKDLFPKLRHLQFQLTADIPLDSIPNYLKSLKLDVISYGSIWDEDISPLQDNLKQKIAQMEQLELLELKIIDNTNDAVSPLSPMIYELEKLSNFRKLSIEYSGRVITFSNILAQTKRASYILDLKVDLLGYFNVVNFFDNLPRTTQVLDLDFYDLHSPEIFCRALSTMNYLRKLIIKSYSNIRNFDCLLRSLPSALNVLTYGGDLDNHDLNGIALPTSLHSVSLGFLKANVFAALANHVDSLEAKIKDLNNILTIKKPLINVKTLIVKSFSIGAEAWLHLFDLLPMKMNMVKIRSLVGDKRELELFEKKILTMKKGIEYFKIYSMSPTHVFNERVYKFDGKEMIRTE